MWQIGTKIYMHFPIFQNTFLSQLKLLVHDFFYPFYCDIYFNFVPIYLLAW